MGTGPTTAIDGPPDGTESLVDFWSREELALWEPPEQIRISEWVSRSVRVPSGSYGASDSIDLDKTPYLREILDCFDNPNVEQICFVASTQTGKTTSLMAMIANAIAHHPGNVIFVTADELMAREMMSDRIKPMIEASPSVRQFASFKKSDWKDLSIKTQQNIVYMAWATSSKRLIQRSAPYLICDEISSWDLNVDSAGDPLRQAIERTRKFPDRKIAKCSTPKLESDLIWKEWLASDQRLYHVPCPHCGSYEVLHFAHLKFPKEARDPAEMRVRRLAYYECPKCRDRILDVHRPAMMLAGVWCPKNCTVSRDGKIEGEQPYGLYRGYRINCCYSPFLTWSDIAAMWLLCKDDQEKLKTFTNNWLAEPFLATQAAASQKQLDAVKLDYELEHIPDGAFVLVAGADVQRTDGVYYVVRAWGARDECWLVAHGRIENDPPRADGRRGATDLEKLGQFMAQSTWRSADKSKMLRVRLCCVDSGDGFRTDEVYDLAKQFPDVIRATKGRATQASPVHTSSHEKQDGRRRFPGAIDLTTIDTNYFKTKLLRRMSAGSASTWHIAKDVSDDYVRQVTSEHKAITADRSGRQTTKWVTKPGQPDNHYFDCEVGAAAAAELLMLPRLLRAPKRAKRRAEESQELDPAPRGRGRRTRVESDPWGSGTGGDWS